VFAKYTVKALLLYSLMMIRESGLLFWGHAVYIVDM